MDGYKNNLFLASKSMNDYESENEDLISELSIDVEDSKEQMLPTDFQSSAGQYSCHLCSFVCKVENQFREHLLTHYTFSCDKCDYASRTEGRLKRHIKDFHSETSPDNFSGQKVPSNNPKSLKCKHCGLLSLTKEIHWNHQRTHLDVSKCMECSQCPFITEYKHHLEYHMRNHEHVKPYKCPKCQYECVNKSMLNSHKKSHSNVYQFRCADCSYASKYCHSLKQHLSRNNHQPAPVLNEDGSLPSYDNSNEILSMKRGPNNRSHNNNPVKSQATSSVSSSTSPNNSSNPSPNFNSNPQNIFPNFPKSSIGLFQDMLFLQKRQANPFDSFVQEAIKQFPKPLFPPFNFPTAFPTKPFFPLPNPSVLPLHPNFHPNLEFSSSNALDLTNKHPTATSNPTSNSSSSSSPSNNNTNSSYYCSKCDETTLNPTEIMLHLQSCFLNPIAK